MVLEFVVPARRRADRVHIAELGWVPAEDDADWGSLTRCGILMYRDEEWVAVPRPRPGDLPICLYCAENAGLVNTLAPL